MKNFISIIFCLFTGLNLYSQNLEKLRTFCIDEVDLIRYEGSLSEEELKEQAAAIGFKYIEDGGVKYHNEIIVYDCNTGEVKFTADFDKNKLINAFVLFEGKDIPEKKINFTRDNNNQYVDIDFNFRGSDISATPVGKAELFHEGKLTHRIQFSEAGAAPTVTVYSKAGNKLAKGAAKISGSLLGEWSIQRIGEWDIYDKGELSNKYIYNSGQLVTNKTFSGGTLLKEEHIISDAMSKVNFYFENGQLQQRGAVKKGEKEGQWEAYDKKGNLVKETIYDSGKKMAEKYFEEGQLSKEVRLITDEEELPSQKYEGEDLMAVTEYYPAGQVKYEGYKLNKVPVAVNKYYNKNGDLTAIKQFDKQGKIKTTLSGNEYKALKEARENYYEELLVIKTSAPLVEQEEKAVKALIQQIESEADSLVSWEAWEVDLSAKIADYRKEGKSLNELSTEQNEYESLLSDIEQFNDSMWSYRSELLEIALDAEKVIAMELLQNKELYVVAEFTEEKKTLFGKKLIVKNEKEDLYAALVEEVIPKIRNEIQQGRSAQEIASLKNQINVILVNFEDAINSADNTLEARLKEVDDISEKKRIFLSKI